MEEELERMAARHADEMKQARDLGQISGRSRAYLGEHLERISGRSLGKISRDDLSG